jgi:hypothetical protein
MRPALAIAILAVLPLSAALADVYRSVDAQGHVLYSDSWTPGAELVRVTNGQARSTLPVTAPASGPKPTTAPPKDNSTDAARDAATKSVHNEVAQNRAEQCKKAQDYYQQVVSARRIFTSDANGERQYMSDADADQARITAKLQMDDLCKGQ